MEFKQKLKLAFTDKVIRARVLFVLFALLIFRLFAAIPIPGIDTSQLANLLEDNSFLGLLNIFSGGGVSSLSIVLLGVAPYITASIIMNLMTVMVPKLKEMQREGEVGRKKVSNYSRLLSIPLAAIQAFGFMKLLQSSGVLGYMTTTELLFNIVIVVAGSVFLMWLGELITEFGIGNGISMIILAGIVAVLPGTIGAAASNISIDISTAPLYIALVVLMIATIFAIVYVTEAERPVPIHHARQARAGTKSSVAASSMPLRLNQAGVIPIIFAISILIMPQMLAEVFQNSANQTIANVSNSILDFLSNQFLYGVIYFGLVWVFTFFYTSVTFDPKNVSENLQKSGAFVPGIRPGSDTEEYLNLVTSRITFIGASFLGIVAILPLVVQYATGLDSIAVGGTAILIVVSVAIDFVKKVDAQITMRQY